MMGHQPPFQGQLFYHNINLDRRIRSDHPLRQIDKMIDFDFVYSEVQDKYGSRGNVSVPPPVILKLMLLLVFYNVRSERELLGTLPERLDWLWFLGLDLDSEIPDHSVLSKARRRWGSEVFKRLFERVVWQCVEAGLVDGEKIFMDSSLIEANASNNSIVDRESLERHVRKGYAEFEQRLEEEKEDKDSNDDEGKGSVNQRHVSMTDPDASVIRQRGAVKPKPRYKTHRAVDGAHEVITATEITPGGVDEAHRLVSLVDNHRKNTGCSAKVVVADSKYGTIDNFLVCHDRGIKAHIPDLKKVQDKGHRREGIFPMEAFQYDSEMDIYRCPAGEELKRRSPHQGRDSADYAAAKKSCQACVLKSQCTTSKTGRTILRHLRQEEIEVMREQAASWISRRDIFIRQHFMERSFAQATRFGFKRMRWRRLWRAQIQDYLTATLQNIKILMTHKRKPLGMAGMRVLAQNFLHIIYNPMQFCF
jgi:transposase